MVIAELSIFSTSFNDTDLHSRSQSYQESPNFSTHSFVKSVKITISKFVIVVGLGKVMGV